MAINPNGTATASEYIAAVRNGNRQHFRVTFSDGTVLNDARIMSDGVTYSDCLNSDTNLVMGKAVSSQIQFSVNNSDGELDDFNYEQEFKAEIGVEINGTTQWANLGVFIGERPERIRISEVALSAYDKMCLFDRDAVPWLDTLSFPMTMSAMLTSLCGYVGVNVGSVSDMVNASKVFESQPLETTGMSCRDALAYIAEASCTYARMSRSGQLEMVWFKPSTYKASLTDQYSTVISEYTVSEIDKLQVHVTDEDLGVIVPDSTENTNCYDIVDNPYLAGETDDDVRPYATNIYNRLVAFDEYIPVVTTVDGNILTECGDIINVVGSDGTEYSMPIFSVDIKWCGGAEITYANTGDTVRGEMSERNTEKLVYGHSKFELVKSIDGLELKVERAHIGDNGVEELHNSSLDISAEGISMKTTGYLTLEAGSDNAATVNGGAVWHGKNMIVSTIQPTRVKSGDIWIKPDTTDMTTGVWTGSIGSKSWQSITDITVTGQNLGERESQNNKYTVKVPMFHTSNNENPITAEFHIVPVGGATSTGIYCGQKQFTQSGWFETTVESNKWLGNAESIVIRVIVYSNWGSLTPSNSTIASVSCTAAEATSDWGWKNCEVYWYAGDQQFTRILTIFKRGSSAPVVPSSLKYNVATDEYVSGLDGWSFDIPSGADTLWETYATATGTGEVTVTGWSEPSERQERYTITRTYDATETSYIKGVNSPIQRGSTGADFAVFSGATAPESGDTFYYTINIPLYWNASTDSINNLYIKLKATVDGTEKVVDFGDCGKYTSGQFTVSKTTESNAWLGDAADITIHVNYQTKNGSKNSLYTYGGNADYRYGTLTIKNFND